MRPDDGDPGGNPGVNGAADPADESAVADDRPRLIFTPGQPPAGVSPDLGRGTSFGALSRAGEDDDGSNDSTRGFLVG